MSANGETVSNGAAPPSGGATADVVIVGGGHNGLTAAACLAKAGRKVVLLEQREHLGGLAAGEEFHPGYRTTGFFHDTCRLRPWVVEKLGLRTQGIRLAAPPPVFVPTDPERGAGLLLHADPERAADELERHAKSTGKGAGDAVAYAEYRAYLEKVRPVILSVMDAPPPDLGSEAALWPPKKMVPLLKSAFGMLRLGQKDFIELLRVGPCAADDWMSEYFESPLVRTALMSPTFPGTWLAPRSPSGAGMLLIGEAMGGDEVVGGPGRLVNALVAACRSQGAELRTKARVRRIVVEDGKVTGVELEGGERISARVVLSAVDPRQTLLELVEPAHLPAAVEREIRTVRFRGTVAKIHLALAGSLTFSCRPGEVFERIRVGEHPWDLERGFDDVRMRRLPQQAPALDVRVPSLGDPSLAPTGHHVASILVPCAPFDLEGGWSDDAKKSLLEASLSSLARYVPELRDIVVAHEVISPEDVAKRFGATGGHVFHGELALDQFWAFRPSPGLSRYATPLKGLFLGSSGSHPMGGITGAPGALAAQAVLDG